MMQLWREGWIGQMGQIKFFQFAKRLLLHMKCSVLACSIPVRLYPPDKATICNA